MEDDLLANTWPVHPVQLFHLSPPDTARDKGRVLERRGDRFPLGQISKVITTFPNFEVYQILKMIFERFRYADRLK